MIQFTPYGITGLVMVIGLLGYGMGWMMRGSRVKIVTRTIRDNARDMTPEERAVFDQAFDHFDAGFDAVRSLFKN